jgi:hypothetical protein
MLASDSGGGDPSALSDAVTVGLPPVSLLCAESSFSGCIEAQGHKDASQEPCNVRVLVFGMSKHPKWY